MEALFYSGRRALRLNLPLSIHPFIKSSFFLVFAFLISCTVPTDTENSQPTPEKGEISIAEPLEPPHIISRTPTGEIVVTEAQPIVPTRKSPQEKQNDPTLQFSTEQAKNPNPQPSTAHPIERQMSVDSSLPSPYADSEGFHVQYFSPVSCQAPWGMERYVEIVTSPHGMETHLSQWNAMSIPPRKYLSSLLRSILLVIRSLLFGQKSLLTQVDMDWV